MDVGLINSFVAAVEHVFATRVKLPVARAKPYALDRSHSTERVFDTAVVIDVEGGARGIVAVRMSRTLAATLVCALTGAEEVTTDADLARGMTELATLLAGAAAEKIAGGQTRVSRPRVLKSPDVRYPKGTPGLVIPFDTGGGRVLLEAVFRPVAQPAAAA